MLTAALLAVVFRVNLPVAVVATLYTNPLTMVPLYFAAYKLGAWVTGHSRQPMPPAELDLNWSNMIDWIPMLLAWLQAMGPPFVAGVFLLGVLLALAGYLAVLAGWRIHVLLAWRRRRRARARAHGPT